MDENKVNEYIKGFPEETQVLLELIRRTISEEAAEAQEMISYGIPTFRLDGNLVHFAAYKNHIGFYPAPSGIKAFESELSAYKKAKGSVQFPINEPLPLDLIRKIVRFRLAENQSKSVAKKSQKMNPQKTQKNND
jgi:uncharacterized protein YdhG (YjbR/CyaY superfamily)